MNNINGATGIGYIRVSTKRQAEEGVSLEVQNREVSSKLNDLGCTDIKMYTDEGKSAKSLSGRDGFQEAIEAAIASKAKYFCTYDTSRFARNTLDAVETVRKLRAHGIELICVTAKFDDTPEGKLIFTVLSSIDQYYSDSLGSKVKASFEKKKEEGYFMGKAPLGYDNIRVAGKSDIVLNDDGRALKKVFKKYIRDEINTLREFAFELDRNGFQQHKPSSFQLASRLIKKPFYAGFYWDKSIDSFRNHRYETIITKDEYKLMQEKLDSKAVKKKSYKLINPDYPLRSMTYCTNCSEKIKGYLASGNGGKYPVYACKTKGCARVTHTDELHNQFEDEISNLEPDEGLLRLFEEILRRSLSAGLTETSEAKHSIKKAIKSVESQQQGVMESLTKVTNPEIIARFETQYSIFSDQIEAYRNELTKIDDKLSEKNCEPIIQNGLDIIRKPAVAWKNASPQLRHHYQKWLFPSGIEYHPDSGLRTRELCYTYTLLSTIEKQGSRNVGEGGIEPPTSAL